ncbi:hypothetical protein [Bacillus sp. V59.32b]|uniref:hypothetical protein n=1 Tax=Bacillus sp. V59.32b TaxID=1758642 RepID=UPI000E3CCE37|nr:hypothetical protein [Bacillus sp. V59.32b]RFU69989.1 hypothetical protein D0463_00495 [Bacillus sp. V59.32b]
MDSLGFFKRKVITTYMAATITAIVMALLYLSESSDDRYDLGNEFLSWSSIFLMYVGLIILVYGNVVSLGIEYIQGRWFKQNTWLFIVLHGVFGLANGLFFQEWGLALYGMMAALFYACIDRWLFERGTERKGVKILLLTPILLTGLLWGFIQFISPSVPPFTKEDAVDFATDGEGTAEELFPKKIGKWKGTIHGYQVERETSAKKAGKETYIVTFTETWKKGGESGSYFYSYKVDRGGLSAYKNGGEEPPYFTHGL